MQDIAQEQARSFQSAYDKEIEGQQKVASEKAAYDRAELSQRAAEERLMAQDRLRLQMQANLFDQQSKRIEAQKSKEFTLAEVKDARTSMNQLTAGSRKMLQDIALNPSRYDPQWAASYVPQLSQALANDTQMVNGHLNDFLSNHKEGDSPNIDFANLESAKLLTAPLINPDVAEASRARTANTISQTEFRAKRYQLLATKASKASSLGAPEKKILDQTAYWSAQSNLLHDKYLDAIRKAGGKTDDANVNLAKQNWDAAESGYRGYESQLNSAVQQGRIPQNFLTSEVSGGIAPQDPTAAPEDFSGTKSSTSTELLYGGAR